MIVWRVEDRLDGTGLIGFDNNVEKKNALLLLLLLLLLVKFGGCFLCWRIVLLVVVQSSWTSLGSPLLAENKLGYTIFVDFEKPKKKRSH